MNSLSLSVRGIARTGRRIRSWQTPLTSPTSMTQNFELESAKDSQFRDFLEQTRKGKHREIHQNSFSSFFKDDWKIRPSITVNLGLRWDYFGTPYDQYGLMGQPKGGKDAVNGLTGKTFNGTLTRIDFIGKNSTSPKTTWENE